MDSSSRRSLAFFFSFLALFRLGSVTSLLVLEDGYTVTTLINGHELKINPHSVLPKPGSSDLIVLDSSSSAFYTLSFLLPRGLAEGGVDRLAGDGAGNAGYSDGEPGLALFKKPRSFAVDLKGNIYVADKSNHAIRKIFNSGGMVRVSTIAGGYSHKVGRQDGPAQNATFSSDFELVFVPEMCALLISDHGNQLVRQIDLKQEDCAKESQHALNSVQFGLLGLGLSCLIGIVIGIAIHSCVITNECCRPPYISTTWKHCLMNLAKLVPLMRCFDIRSAVAKSRLCALLRRLLQLVVSHLSLRFGITPVGSQIPKKGFVSLLDSDVVNSSKVEKLQMCADQLKDLIDFGGDLQSLSMEKEIEEGEWEDTSRDVLPGGQQKSIDNMIVANIAGFTLATRETTKRNRHLAGNSGLVRRKGSSQN